MKKKIKLKKETKILLLKIAITLFIAAVDVVLYHYLGIVGEYQGTTSWCNAFLITGWVWLVFGNLPLLSFIWEE